jgi:hypothetical protein
MAAALVVGMVDCCNRHDTDALAACYAPDTWSIPPAGRRRSTAGPGWPPSASSWPPSPTCGSIRATWLPTAGWRYALDWHSALRRWKRKVRVSALRSRQPALRSSRPALRAAALGRQHHWARGIQDKPSILNGEGVDEGRTRVSR